MDSATEFLGWQFMEGDDTVTGRQAGENIETLGDTLAKMMAKTLDDIMPSRGKGPDTW